MFPSVMYAAGVGRRSAAVSDRPDGYVLIFRAAAGTANTRVRSDEHAEPRLRFYYIKYLKSYFFIAFSLFFLRLLSLVTLVSSRSSSRVMTARP